MALITVKGNVSRDPEVRYTQDGRAVAKFGVAESFQRKQADGSWAGPTKWHNVVAFGNFAQSLGDRLHKGDRVVIAGKTSLREYEKDGETRQSEELQISDLLDHTPKAGRPAEAAAPAADTAPEDLDDLPF